MADDIEGLHHFELGFLKDEPSVSVITLTDTADASFRVNLTQKNLIEFISGLIVQAGKGPKRELATGEKTTLPLPMVIPTSKMGFGSGPSQETVLWFEVGALQLAFAVSKTTLLEMCAKALDQADTLPSGTGPQRH